MSWVIDVVVRLSLYDYGGRRLVLVVRKPVLSVE